MTALLLASLAFATTPCGQTLQAELQQASTMKVPEAYVALAECDAARGRTMAPIALEKMFGDDNEAIAVRAMVDVGALDSLVPWLERIPPDDRMSMLRSIGDDCQDHPERNAFFGTLLEQKGDRFFIDRWYRGLDECRSSEGRAILTNALESERFGVGATERGSFLDILEVYTRNLRTDALPLLQSYARELGDDEEIAYALQIMPKAAGYDTDEGVDPAQAEQVSQAIFALGDILDPTRIDIARASLQRIGQAEVADSLVRYRWPDAWRVGGGRYHYAAMATYSWECRPGRQTVIVHSGEFAEDGKMWPDALATAAEERLAQQWAVEDAPCDAAPAVSVSVSEQPLKTANDREQWLSSKRAPFVERVKKRSVELVTGETFAW